MARWNDLKRAQAWRQAVLLTARPALTAGVLLFAAEAGSQQITAQAIVSGGGVSRSAGGCRALAASLGEAVVGRVSGGDYTVTAGFTAATAATPRDAVFHDGFQVCR